MKKPHPKPTAHKLKFSIQVSRSSLCTQKKLKSFDSGEGQYLATTGYHHDKLEKHQ